MNTELKEAYIVAYGRSAVGRAKKGGLAFTNPVDYGAAVLKGVLDQIPQLDRGEIDDVIVGCAMPQGVQGVNIGRVIAVRAELPFDVPGQTVNRFCSSGLQAISTAANMIMTGQADVMVGGGVESMTAIPMGGGATRADRDDWVIENAPAVYMPMGMTAENVAEKWGVSRAEMDAMGYTSHMRAAKARAEGKFKKEISPIEVKDAEGNVRVFAEDDGIRPNCTMEGMTGLKPCFKEDGVVTAGTSSQTSDGAGFVVLMSKEKMESLGIKPIARFISFAVAGVDPKYMGIGPAKAVPKVMKRTGLTIDDMDVIELNEAFAAQAIAVMRELKMDPEKINVNGGAMAMGHPLGATGAILTCKALSELERINGRYALITMCIGSGMGAAGIIERIQNN